MSKANRMQRGFGLLAPIYDLLARLFFGNALLRSQIYWLPSIEKFNTVLILGGGTGKILQEFLKIHPEKIIYYVEISDQMISQTRSGIKRIFPELNADIHYIHGSEEDIPPSQKFDLIITPYVLDCWQGAELSGLMFRLDKKLSEKGKWIFADFEIPSTGIFRLPAKVLVRVLYFFFNLSCGLGIKKLPEFKKLFEALGHTVEKEVWFFRGILTAKIYSKA